MRVEFALAFLLAACVSSAPPDAPAAAAARCIPDREAFLALDINTFDQSPTGWRGIVDKGEACELPAADLIAEYRVKRADVTRHQDSLIHHEGQIRAANGETDRALVLFRQNLDIAVAEANGIDDTDTLRDRAEIAFLTGDRVALIASRDQLAALPMPPGMAKAMEAAAAKQATLGRTIKLEWPLNLTYVDNLVRCFGRSFREATKLGCPNRSNAAPG